MRTRWPLLLYFHTCIVGRHGAQVIMKLCPPLIGGLQSVGLEEVVQEGEEHGVVVWQDKQVHCQ